MTAHILTTAQLVALRACDLQSKTLWAKVPSRTALGLYTRRWITDTSLAVPELTIEGQRVLVEHTGTLAGPLTNR